MHRHGRDMHGSAAAGAAAAVQDPEARLRHFHGLASGPAGGARSRGGGGNGSAASSKTGPAGSVRLTPGGAAAQQPRTGSGRSAGSASASTASPRPQHSLPGGQAQSAAALMAAGPAGHTPTQRPALLAQLFPFEF